MGPPTPNSSSLHVFGNNNVNHYSGTAEVKIPLYEIVENGISVPIYLNYTGGNGIKVSEFASWVGLGWSLNTGGAISRVIRGKADEDTSGGFFTLTDLPRPTNNSPFTDFESICEGTLDGEPDSFYFKYPEGSGEFLFDMNKNSYLKPKRNISLEFSISNVSGDHPNAGNPVSLYHDAIHSFEIKSSKGYIYTFNDKEYSNFVTFGIPYSDNRAFPSTWYLSEIKNPVNSSQIIFDYDPYRFETILLNGSIAQSGLEEDAYIQNTYLARRIKKITFSEGTIEFIAGNGYRKDIKDEKYLESIVIKDKNGNIKKKFLFKYQYSTGSAFVDIDAALGVSSSNRLVLKEVQEIGENGETTIPPYIFTYNQDSFLPKRDSKSIDHWGFYNGEPNQKFEASYFFTWYKLNLGWQTDQFGSANREASPFHASAGILTKIKYPTGGCTHFNYEGNQASNYTFQNSSSEELVSEVLSFQNDIRSISIEREVMTSSQVQVEYQNDFYNGTCYPKVYFKNAVTNSLSSLSFNSQSGNILNITLPEGQYDTWFEFKSATGQNCIQEDPIILKLNWINLISTSGSAIVGGLRLNSTHNKLDDITVSSRHFEYKDDQDNLSGTLLGQPKYAYLIEDLDTGIPYLMRRWSQSAYPLLSTQGSVVGYGKVSVSQTDSGNGLTEYYFTNTSDFPDSFHATSENGTFKTYSYFEGEKYQPYPIGEIDSKEYLRGNLKLKKTYKLENGQLRIIRSEENIYKNAFYNYEDIASSFHYLKDNFQTAEGLKVYGENCSGALYFKYFHHFTGYALLERTIIKEYSNNNEISEIISNIYSEDENGLVKWLFPSYSIISTSQAVPLIFRTYYPGDVQLKSSLGLDLLTDTEKSAIDLLQVNHRLLTPIQKDIYKDQNLNGFPEDSELISSVRTNFSTISNLLLPENVKSLKAPFDSSINKMETRINYLRYDSSGNPLEVVQVDGPTTVYLWGYSDQKPIAKIENATYQQVASALSVPATTLDNYTEANLGIINALRNNASLLQAMITSYSYEPLVGVTTITDPKGYTLTYEYDAFNRLEFIRDPDGNIIKEYRYKYKNL